MTYPRPQRKGRKGCYFCGEPTEVIVQVWMREFVDERYAGGNRRSRTVKSISISLCRPHGEEFFEKHTADIPTVSERDRDRGDPAGALRKRIGGNGV